MTFMICCQRCGQIHLIGDACQPCALFNKNENENKEQRKILGFGFKDKKYKVSLTRNDTYSNIGEYGLFNEIEILAKNIEEVKTKFKELCRKDSYYKNYYIDMIVENKNEKERF